MSAHMQKASFTERMHSQGHRPLGPAGDGEPDAVLKAALNHTPPKNHARPPHRHGITHLLTALTPLVIGELIDDPSKRWRWVKVGALATAVVGELELCWQDRVRQREWKEREASHGREVAQR